MKDPEDPEHGEQGFAPLAARWKAGDRRALVALIQRNETFLRAHVSRRLGQALRRVGDTEDFLQVTLVELLRWEPRYEVASEAQFRSLVAQVAENALRGQHDYWVAAQKRSVGREEALSEGSPPGHRGRNPTPPDEAALREEKRKLLKLALERLTGDDGDIVRWHVLDDETFGHIGERLGGLSEDAVRKRFNRALPRLYRHYKGLNGGASTTELLG